MLTFLGIVFFYIINFQNFLKNNNFFRTLFYSNGNSSIAEDVLLEDMCEIASIGIIYIIIYLKYIYKKVYNIIIYNIEYDGDATVMNTNEKNKMLNRLSKNQKTEQYFRDEKALSQFFDNRYYTLIILAY